MNSPPLVTVIDDDLSVREALPDLIKLLGYAVHAFASAEDFLVSDQLGMTDCLILDVAMPGMTGPELYVELNRRGHHIPVVFITAHRDFWTRSSPVGYRSEEYLLKPFSEDALVTALETALRAH